MSTFEQRRAANMARNNEILAGLTSLPAATMASAAPPAPTTTTSRKTAVKSAPAVAERKSSRVVTRTPVYKEKDLFPDLALEDDVKKTPAAAKSKKRKRGDDNEEKDDGGDDDEGGTGEAADSAGEEKKKKRVRPSYRERPEWGLTRLSITEVDLATIRVDYDVMRLSAFAIAGILPAEYSEVKKHVRITNGEFDKLNDLRVARGEDKLVRKMEEDPEWVAASVTASEREEEHLRKKAEKAKKNLAMA